jgi:putative protein-disulfide isomerase
VSSNESTGSERPVVVYGNDPLCGWCFAIGPDLVEAKRRTIDRFDWRVECGGLVVGDRVHPIALDRDYLVAGLAQVERVTGRRAGAAYFDGLLAQGTWISDSEPSCRAVIAARSLDPVLAIDFSHGLTDALYLDGREPDAPDTVRDVADAVGFDGAELVARWTASEATAELQRAFVHARSIGITTYPSLFVEWRGERIPVLAGWADADTIVERLDAALG